MKLKPISVVGVSFLTVVLAFSGVLNATTYLEEINYPVRIVNVDSIPVVVEEAKLMKNMDTGDIFVYVSLENKDKKVALKNVTFSVTEIDASRKNVLQSLLLQIPYSGNKAVIEKFNLADSGNSEIVVVVEGYENKNCNSFRLSNKHVIKLIRGLDVSEKSNLTNRR